MTTDRFCDATPGSSSEIVEVKAARFYKEARAVIAGRNGWLSPAAAFALECPAPGHCLLLGWTSPPSLLSAARSVITRARGLDHRELEQLELELRWRSVVGDLDREVTMDP